jgi:hypothetical protein
MTWISATGHDRRLVFVGFAEHGAGGSDRWYPIVDGGFTEVQEESRRIAGISGRKVIIIALPMDVPAPTGLGEKALMRLGQPWY